MSHAAMSRLNSRHHFTSRDPVLHIDGGSQSPFARSQVVLDAAPTAVNIKADPTLRSEIAKKELESKLKSRSSNKQMLPLADRAFSVVSQVSCGDGDDDVEDEYGEVSGWRFDETAEADRANEILLRFEGNSSSTPTPHSPLALGKLPSNERSMQSIRSFSSNLPNVESESTALLERSGSFMKLHSLKTFPVPKSRGGLTRDTTLEKNQSILASVDVALSSFVARKAPKSPVPQKKETATVNREDLFPAEAHKIKFHPPHSAPSEEDFRTLFEVKDINSFILNQQGNLGKLEPIQAHNVKTVGHSSGQIHSMEPKIKGFVMRPPPLNLEVTLGGSAVMNQSTGSSMGSILRSPQHLSVSPLFRNGKSSETGNSRSRHATVKPSLDGNASPLSTASSSFLLQALKKTSSFLAMPLPMLALAPFKQEAENISAESPQEESVTSHQLSPINAQMLQFKSEQHRKTGILSERHKRIIGESSPGVGTPVIYVPQAEPSKSSESYISGSIGLLEVGNPKLSRFKTSKVNAQLDEFAIKNASSSSHLDVTDVGPSKPSKDLDDIWSACWDDEAGAVYYYNKNTGEATWLPPKVDEAGDHGNEEDFFQIINSGLTKELLELNIGDSDLTIKTKRIAARHKLWSKLRNRYEGDTETQFSQTLLKEEKVHYSKLEDSEVLWEYQKELSDWVVEI